MTWRAFAVLLIAGSAMAAYAGPSPATAPPPDQIADTADRILSGSAYSLDETTNYSFRILGWIGDRITEFLEWLSDRLGLGAILGGLSMTTLKIVIGVCIATLLGILIYNGYVLYRLRRIPEESFATIGPARTVTAAEMMAESQRLAHESNFVDASRRLFVAALILLEEKRGGRLRHGLTNSEYLNSFQTRWIRDYLRVFVDLINWKWYRHQTFNADDYQRCRDAFESLAARLGELDA